uniref:No mechanoreceptor potential B, isoform D n=1 Tax=Drosophila melanogaster TaxID=7227 RepID=Q7KRS6_DROME|nr:no mechanoreceptor potential B, isoform D [Drosophila melanogaster]AAF57218.4 no mechanoreceptor potential B, isoform D [Drosophila melanogaster]|eukprot:NP_724347.3 no mechanoreceptor potential B, isoform D [Drosophila melanogaster]
MTSQITANGTQRLPEPVSEHEAVPPPPPTAAGRPRPPTSQLFSRGNLASSRATGGDKSGLARPSTAVRAVGYAANCESAHQRFEQFFLEKAKQQTLSSRAAVDAIKDVNPQMKYKNLEEKIVKLLESSIVLAWQGSPNKLLNLDTKLAEALSKAKEAFSLDRTLHQFRDQHGENVYHNFDLTYAQYERSEMHIEALNTYSIMAKNKMFPHVNQLKLNMGNIYYSMGIYQKAVKMYRMALDSVPKSLSQLRLKIRENIGILFIRMGSYSDAASSFEFIMTERANIRSSIHLLLCYFALGDVEKVKLAFRRLCDVQTEAIESDMESETNIIKLQQQAEPIQQIGETDGYQSLNNEPVTGSVIKAEGGGKLNETVKFAATVKHRYVVQALKKDELAVYRNERRNAVKRSITMIVDLISPFIEDNYNDGYNWCIEIIKTSNLAWLANELELNKALVYLRQNDVHQAIETLQMYDRKSEGSMTASALTNLSFIYIKMASHCVNQLHEIGSLKNNAPGLINAGIVELGSHNLILASERFEGALQLQPMNFEARYNLGLVALAQNDYELAEERFELLKEQLMLPSSVQHSHVFYQLAKLQERRLESGLISNFTPGAALQAYLQVVGISASDIDSRLFEKVGSLYEQIQDHQEANQYYNEAYRINMSDIGIASSIGSYYIKLQATERALFYYERAVLADPNDPNLMLRIASCFRNSYLPTKQYLGLFQKIHARFPDNLTCIRALMQVTKSLELGDLYERYASEYTRLQSQQQERQSEQRYQQQRFPSAAKFSNRLRSIRQSNEEHLKEVGENFNSVVHTQSPYTSILQFDPLGPPAERPKTGRPLQSRDDVDDDAEMNPESLLPI